MAESIDERIAKRVEKLRQSKLSGPEIIDRLKKSWDDLADALTAMAAEEIALKDRGQAIPQAIEQQINEIRGSMRKTFGIVNAQDAYDATEAVVNESLDRNRGLGQ